MRESFAQRMAAQVASEGQMASSGSAAGGADDADPEDLANETFLPAEHDQGEHQQSEQEAAGAGEPQNSLSSAEALE